MSWERNSAPIPATCQSHESLCWHTEILKATIFFLIDGSIRVWPLFQVYIKLCPWCAKLLYSLKYTVCIAEGGVQSKKDLSHSRIIWDLSSSMQLMENKHFFRTFSRLMIVSYGIIKADISCHFHLIFSSHKHLWGTGVICLKWELTRLLEGWEHSNTQYKVQEMQ